MPRTRYTVLIASLTVALIIGPSSVALAVDYCIGTLDAFYVLKGFKVPSPGKCTSASGYVTTTNVANTMVGNACTDSARTHLTINLTVQYPALVQGQPGATATLLVFNFPYPSLTSGYSHEYRIYPSPEDLGDSG